MSEYCHRLMATESGARLSDPRFLLPSSRPHYAPDREFDATHIKIQVDLDIPNSSFDGTCTTTMRAFADGAKKVVFDAVDMKVKSVTAGGRKCVNKYDKKQLTITMPRAYKAGETVDIA